MKTIEDFKAVWPENTPFLTFNVMDTLNITYEAAKEILLSAEAEMSVSFFSYGYMFVEPF